MRTDPLIVQFDINDPSYSEAIKIGKNSEEFQIVGPRNKLTKNVGLYDLKSLIPKFNNHDL